VLFARGEVVATEHGFAVKILEIVEGEEVLDA
jgi:flagellar motor switch/type III secretory pathway protein FliN